MQQPRKSCQARSGLENNITELGGRRWRVEGGVLPRAARETMRMIESTGRAAGGRGVIGGVRMRIGLESLLIVPAAAPGDESKGKVCLYHS